MKFKYLGDEYTEWFGFKWITGMVHDVTDAHAIKKLSGSVLFEALEGSPAETPPNEPEKRKPGRPKKEVTHDDALSE